MPATLRADVPPAEMTITNRPDEPKKRGMSRRGRFLFFLVAWLIVLMPFLFWRGTWFGRTLTDQQITQSLHDDAKPRNIQHALVQISQRMEARKPVAQWYPDLVRLSAYPNEDIRNTDAWLMGQENTRPEFHEALRKMLTDSSMTVRENAALALVRFNDPAGHDVILNILTPEQVIAPQPGKITGAAKAGTAIRKGGLLATIENAGQKHDVRSPVTGRISKMEFQNGDTVSAGVPLATVNASSDQVWEALRAMYLIGLPGDIPSITPYAEGRFPDMPDKVAQQARLTADEIRRRAEQK